MDSEYLFKLVERRSWALAAFWLLCEAFEWLDMVEPGLSVGVFALTVPSSSSMIFTAELDLMLGCFTTLKSDIPTTTSLFSSAAELKNSRLLAGKFCCPE